MSDPNDIPSEIGLLLNKIIEFRDAREWKQFHTLKNLASALSVEASELLELTQWKSESELEILLKEKEFSSELAGEIADVFIYLLLICDKAKIDPIASAHDKIKINDERYPADRARGSAAKYSNLRQNAS